MTGFGLTGRPPIDSPPDLGRRYWCRSLPHIPEAFISSTTSPGPGVGSGNSWISSLRLPRNTMPRMANLLRTGGSTLSRPPCRLFTVDRRWTVVVALLAVTSCSHATLPYTPERQPEGSRISAGYQLLADRLRIEIDT